MTELARGPNPQKLDAVFHALSDERRRDMIERLARHPLTVSELAEPTGMRLPAAVKHLAALESGGIVVSKKIGRTRTYRLRPDAFDTIDNWIGQRRAAMNTAFDRLEQAIAEFPEEGSE